MEGRVVDDLELDDDADLPELLLGQGEHLRIEERLADEVVLDREAVRVARLGQELLRDLRVVLRKLHRDVAEVTGGQAARRHPREPAGIHGLLDGLAIDRVHERLADADIVEGRLGHVDVKAFLAAGPAAIDDRAHLLHLVREVGGDRLRVEQVERPLLETDQLGRVLGHVVPVHLVDLRPAAVELVEGFQDDLVARRVALEVERPGTDRAPLELVTQFLGRLLRDDVAVLVADHAQQKDRIERLERDLQRVRIDDLDRLDHVEVDAVAGTRCFVDLALEAELDVLGRQLAVALVELHALPELERPDRAFRRERPALGQVRLDLCGGDLAVLDGEAREPAEHEAGDGLTLSERARVRVERIGLLGGDVEDLLLRLRGRGRDEPNNPEHRDEYDEHEQAEPDWPCHGFLLFR